MLVRRVEQLEVELERVRDELESSSRLSTLGLLTGAIAHEFNNILTPVLSYARAALEEPEDGEFAIRALDRAARGVEQATRVAGSVLRLAGAGQEEPDETGWCDPAEAVGGAVACLQRPPERDRVDLRVTIEPGVWVHMRRTDLEHVVLNLLLNAIRVLKPGGGVIEIECRPTAACSTWNSAELVVRDDGPGIRPEFVRRLFEDPAGNRALSGGQGHGLGLVICRRLVEAADGRLDVTSEPGAGTEFRIRLAAESRERADAA